jgi:hypothetical protein
MCVMRMYAPLLLIIYVRMTCVLSCVSLVCVMCHDLYHVYVLLECT